MARKQDLSYALVKKMRDGWYYRLGSGASYPWLGPFETQHVAERVRESVTGGPWGTKPSRSHATMGWKTLYVVTVPPTAEVGSYKTRVRGPMSNARRDALWDYNSARRHDGLPPVDRMPRGTKYTKEG